MPKKPTKPVRRQRRHGDLPAGYRWRDGRPRWEPSPARRAQGWRGRDLKDAWGRWLAEGAAIDKARAIAGAVAGWAAGGPVPADLAGIAPAGSAPNAPAAGAPDARSIGALLDAYQAADRFRGLAPRSQADYRNKLSRFLEVLAGSAEPRKITAVRALLIDVLLPPAFDQPGEFELERVYETLRETAGEAMAAGVLACVSAWLGWCVKKRRIWPTNPAELVERGSPDGRIVVYDWPELVAIVRAAEAAGLTSIADAVILAVDLSWSQQDLLAMTWGQISASGHVKHRRIKTGVAGNPPLLAIGAARIAQIKARWEGQTVRPMEVIVCELTGRAWKADHFRHKFAEIRAAAAQHYPDVAFKQFRDLRDTSVTYCIDAGLTVDRICSRTLHAPTRAQAVISKHYGAIRQDVADEAKQTLDAWFELKGYTFDQKALPAPGGE